MTVWVGCQWRRCTGTIRYWLVPDDWHRRSKRWTKGLEVDSQVHVPRLSACYCVFANPFKGSLLYFVHGDKSTHNPYFSEGAFEKMTGQKPAPGKKLLTNAASLDGLQKGTYIINGEKRIIEWTNTNKMSVSLKNGTDVFILMWEESQAQIEELTITA